MCQGPIVTIWEEKPGLSVSLTIDALCGAAVHAVRPMERLGAGDHFHSHIILCQPEECKVCSAQ